MSSARLLSLLLSVSAGCTSFQDALLSDAEDGGEPAPDASVESAEPPLDADSAVQDAATIPAEAASEGLDAAAEPALEAGAVVDSAQPDDAKSCCQQWDELLDAGVFHTLPDPLDSPLDPLLGCIELRCKLMLPSTHP